MVDISARFRQKKPTHTHTHRHTNFQDINCGPQQTSLQSKKQLNSLYQLLVLFHVDKDLASHLYGKRGKIYEPWYLYYTGNLGSWGINKISGLNKCKGIVSLVQAMKVLRRGNSGTAPLTLYLGSRRR